MEEARGGRRASSAADFFSRRPSSSFFQSMRRYSSSTVFGGGSVEAAAEAGAGAGRRHSGSPGAAGPAGRGQDKWRSLARAVLGDVAEGGEGRAEETDTNCDGGGGRREKRGFSGKWAFGIRKISSKGNLEKSASMGGHDARNLQNKISKNKFKVPAGPGSLDDRMGNKQSPPRSDTPARPPTPPAGLPPSGRLRGEDQPEDGEPELEVPPPMRPISSLPLPEDPAPSSKEPADWGGLSDGLAGSLPGLDLNQPCDEADPCPAAPPEPDPDPATKSIEQRSYRLQELLESEQKYVTDLEQAATYISYMRDSKVAEEADIRMPDDLREGKDRMIFGNLENIYEWHRDFFSKNLEKCIANPIDLGNLFKKYERKFQMYVVYCQNKPKSEHIVSEHINDYFEEIRLKYGFKLRLTDLLIKPIQRLTKYHMLLEAILKHSQRAGLTEETAALEAAFRVMTIVPNQANDMMDIGRLQGFEGKIVSQGKLLLRGPLNCCDDPSTGPNFKMKEMTVFLFEQIMMFAETVGKKTQFTSPNYNYKAHVQVNKMLLEEKVDGDSEGRMFRVKSTDPRGPPLQYVCQAEDAANRARWTGTMAKQLQTQKEFLQALQAPIAYHNKQKHSASDLNQQWEVKPSTPPPHQRGLTPGSRPQSNPLSGPGREREGGRGREGEPGPLLAVQEAWHRAVSLPSSPVVKAPPTPFPPTGPEESRKPRSASEKSKREQQAAAGTSGTSQALGRRTFLEGLRRRARSRSGESLLHDAGLAGLQGRLQEDPPAELGPCGLMTPGSSATVHIDYRAVRDDEISVSKGDSVTVLSSNLSRGYLVHRAASAQSPAAEGWVPSYCLHLSGPAARRPSAWAFRVRKKSLTRQPEVTADSAGGFTEHLNNVSVVVGETAVLSCRVEGAGRPVWKGPGGALLAASGRLALARGEGGAATLTLAGCRAADAGEYHCLLPGEAATASTSCRLQVTLEPGPPGQPRVQDLRGSRAVVTWERGETGPGRAFSLHSCRLGEAGGGWQEVRSGLTDGLCIVESLEPGQAYSFRVTSSAQPPGGPASAPSLPSAPLTVPLPDLPPGSQPSPLARAPPAELPDPAWQPDFELQYIELEEVGRGRFSVVRRCQEILTGREVAVKFVNRRKQDREETKREYELLSRLQHPGLLSASGLFTTASSDAIVMDLVCGPPLLDWLCESPSYTESRVHGFTSQLLSGLAFLHSSAAIHLDLRPEHCLLEADTVTLRLVDLGAAQAVRRGGQGMNMARPDSAHAGPEFLPPEALGHGPVGPYSDMWAAGVLLHLLLTGASPFLEETDEETAGSVLRCDLSFPATPWDGLSSHAKDLVSRLLVSNPCLRITASSCLSSPWARHARGRHTALSSRPLAAYLSRRHKRVQASASGLGSGFTQIPRPESLYKKLPS